MKKFIGLQLTLFFLSACMLYLYASNALGGEHKLVLDMTSREADVIWKAVNNLEDSWLPKGMQDTEEMKKMRDTAQAFLDKFLYSPYEDLVPVVEQLMNAYNAHRYSEFNRQKIKISQMLSHIWASEFAQAKEKEQKRRSSLGWLGRMREDAAHTMNRLYYYLFGGKKVD